jgi:hypothetical protein
MRIAAHATIAQGRESRQFLNELAVVVEEFLWLVTAHPGFKNLEMFRILAYGCERHLMRAECAFDRDPVHFLGAGPSLRCAKDDHRPDGLLS